MNESGLITAVKRTIRRLALPAPAQREARIDRRLALGDDPGPEAVITACLDWLGRAQDMSASSDGGVARDYSFVAGWATSYPETTGYIVPTFLQHANVRDDPALRERARRMLDWMVSIQFPEGGFMGGKIDAQPRVPVTFNTGQILIGLAAGVREFGDAYREPMNRAAGWLRDTLDEDGCWRRFPTPFASPGEKVYETHVSWGLFEAARIEPERGYGEAGLKQVDWALTKQRPNGWFASCCLSDPAFPLTHTIGYVLRGVIEAYLYSGRDDLLAAAERTACGVMQAQREDGYMAAHLDSEWRAAADYACLTGIVQLASCWLLLYRATGETQYRDAGYRANAYVRRTVRVNGGPDLRGGVKGAFPVDGGYGTFQFLNWAAKFCVDSNWHELEVRREGH